MNCSEKGKRRKVKISLNKSIFFAQTFHKHPLIRTIVQNCEEFSLEISSNGTILIKFTHILAATAKWTSSRHRQGRYGGKTHSDSSRKLFRQQFHFLLPSQKSAVVGSRKCCGLASWLAMDDYPSAISAHSKMAVVVSNSWFSRDVIKIKN